MFICSGGEAFQRRLPQLSCYYRVSKAERFDVVLSMTETTENTEKTYEELFAHRYSAEDREYQQYLNRPSDPPPIVEDWRSRGGGHRGRDNRYQDRRGGRGWGGDRGWRGDHRGQQHWQNRDRDRDRDRDRHWGHGSGYQSGPPSSNQGYNSHHQRPHYDRY